MMPHASRTAPSAIGASKRRPRHGGLLAFALCVPACLSGGSDEGLPDVQRSLDAIVATCSGAVGDVRIRRKGFDHWEEAAPQAVLRGGDWVRTGLRGFVRIAFLAGSALEAEESALVMLDEGDKGQVVMSLAEGVVRGTVAQASDDEVSPWLVADQDGSQVFLRSAAEQGGTAVRLSPGGQGNTEIAVSWGEAQLSVGGRDVVLRAGEAADFGQGRLGDVVELIGFARSVAPGVDARFHWHRGLPLQLRWEAVEGAMGYRVQVARDLSFRQLVANCEVETTTFTHAVESPGTYVWRVAARQRDGRYGEYGFSRRAFFEEQEPIDLLVAPADGQVVHAAVDAGPPEVAFTWQARGVARYRLIVAKTVDLFQEPLVNRIVRGQRVLLALPGLRPGPGSAADDYFWGVFTDDRAKTPLFTKPRRLEVRAAW